MPSPYANLSKEELIILLATQQNEFKELLEKQARQYQAEQINQRAVFEKTLSESIQKMQEIFHQNHRALMTQFALPTIREPILAGNAAQKTDSKEEKQPAGT